MATARWISIALLTPFWWASGLMLLALLGDLLPSCRARAFDLFDRLERTRVARPAGHRQGGDLAASIFKRKRVFSLDDPHCAPFRSARPFAHVGRVAQHHLQ